MGNSGEFDFIQQLLSQAPMLLIMPLFFGGLYIASMVFIFRRAAKRRAKAKAALTGSSPIPAAATPAPRSRLSRLTPAVATANSAPLPEPDLDLLTMLVGDTGTGANAPAEKPKNAPAPAPDPAPTPAPAVAAFAPPVERSVSAPAAPDAPPDSVEVLRLWRDLSDGGLIVGVGGRLYRSAAEIDNADVSRRLAGIARELATLAGGTSPASPIPSAPVVAPPLAGSGVAWGAPTAPVVPGVIRTEPIKPTAKRRGQPEEPAPGGIAAAVEEFLQFKLMSNPQFATRSIHIRPSVDGGVLIEVDGHYYEGIGDVIDPDVREFLASMMKEWEARH